MRVQSIPGGHSQKHWVGVYDPPHPFYDQNLRFSLPSLWPDEKFDTLFMTVALNIISYNYEGFLLMVLSIIMKRTSSI